MGAIDSIDKIPLLYHFTDRRNLPSIRSEGGLYPRSHLAARKIKIPAPGGNEWSHDADALKGMENYIHLCFRNNHPMEYAARADGRITDSIFLQIHPSVLGFDGVLFTSDVANKSGVVPLPVKDAQSIIDFEVLYTVTIWSDPDIQARLKAVEKYEILVPHPILIPLIRNMPNG